MKRTETVAAWLDLSLFRLTDGKDKRPDPAPTRLHAGAVAYLVNSDAVHLPKLQGTQMLSIERFLPTRNTVRGSSDFTPNSD